MTKEKIFKILFYMSFYTLLISIMIIYLGVLLTIWYGFGFWDKVTLSAMLTSAFLICSSMWLEKYK